MTDRTFRVDDRRFGNSVVVQHGRIDAKDLENIRDPNRNKGGQPILSVGEQTPSRRWMSSAMDIAEIRTFTALCGPKFPGGLRSFMSPAMASSTVRMVCPLHRFVELDDEGHLKAPGDVTEQWFVIVKAVGTDAHTTVEVLNGRDVIADLGTIDNQAMIIPITRLVYEVVKACGEIVKQENEIKEELVASVTDAFRKAGRLEEDE